MGVSRGGQHNTIFGRGRGRPPSNLPHKGGGFGQEVGDALDHATGVGEDIAVPEADNAKPFAFEKTSAVGVTVRRHCMLATVELNDKLCRMAREIGKIQAQRNLFAPVAAWKRFPQRAPQDTFGLRHSSAQATRPAGRIRRQFEPS
jgi:hypothetical protein